MLVETSNDIKRCPYCKKLGDKAGKWFYYTCGDGQGYWFCLRCDTKFNQYYKIKKKDVIFKKVRK